MGSLQGVGNHALGDLRGGADVHQQHVLALVEPLHAEISESISLITLIVLPKTKYLSILRIFENQLNDPAGRCRRDMTMEFLPIFLDLQGKPCLVVGGGATAARKVSSLLRAGVAVTLVSPSSATPSPRKAEAGEIRHLAAPFRADRHLAVTGWSSPPPTTLTSTADIAQLAGAAGDPGQRGRRPRRLHLSPALDRRPLAGHRRRLDRQDLAGAGSHAAHAARSRSSPPATAGSPS